MIQEYEMSLIINEELYNREIIDMETYNKVNDLLYLKIKKWKEKNLGTI